jgi:SAM-dependent methyltransferase
MSSSELPESVARNIADWTRANAEYTDASAAAAWAAEEITWGIWRIPESELRALPEDAAGLDVVELGCGTAYFSAWLAKRGARPVGVDPTPAQLATARRLQAETGIEFPLVEAPGERVPLPDAAFDLALSEYGAALWAVPERWVAEASRLLRPGGLLVFLTNSVLLQLCVPDAGPAEERLQRPQFGMYSVEWPDQEGVEYHLAHGDWIRLLGENGFGVKALIEIQAPAGATEHEYYSDLASPEWARKWPTEEIWVARKRG